MTPRPTGILAEIVARTLADVDARKSRVGMRELEEHGALRAGSRRDLTAALRRDDHDPPRFLCEVKKASPSKGVLCADLDPHAQASIYAEHKAAGISVVTEPHFFQGDPSFLDQVREAAPRTPILRKDFHVHELQILETAGMTADALLLLAAVLSPNQLKDYLDIADAFGLGHLVEVNNTREAEVALRAGARVVGVNNRDLTTFDVNVARTEAVLPALAGTGVVSVSESGIRDRETVVRLADAGVHAFLVGEALVTADDPGAKLLELRGEDPGAS